MTGRVATMLPLLLLAASACSSSGPGVDNSYPPARQSAYQRQYMANVSSLAAAASAAATPRVLSALGSLAFKQQLAACCPQLVGLPAGKLLALIEAEVAVAEITHNFGNPAPDSNTGPNTSGMAALSAVPNTWMSALRGDMNPPNPQDSNGLWQCEGGLEIGIFGMKGFSLPSPAWMQPKSGGTQFTTPDSGVGWPANLSEAADRPVYGIWNLWKQAMPGRMYGSTALVFRNSVVQASTFIAPMDSGAWIQECNATRQMSEYPCNPLSWGPDGPELLNNASACLCDGDSDHDLARCEAAQRSHNRQGMVSRNSLCVWNNGSSETLWQCPGGLQENVCTNGTVVTRPAPAGSPMTNGSCNLLPGLTVDSKDAAGRNLWLSCVDSGPGDQCGVCAAIPTAPHEAQGTLAAWHHILAMSADYWKDTTAHTLPNDPNASWTYDPTAYPSLPSRLATILGRSSHAQNRSRLSHGVDRDFLEADVVANITYATGVKFLLADFPTLFGSAHGAQLQAWAAENGWALVWSLGWREGNWGADGFPGGNGTDSEDRRLLDLSFLTGNTTATTIGANLSALDAAAGRTFMEKWAAVSTVRRELTPPAKKGQPPSDPMRWAEVWTTIATACRAASLHPLSAASCSDIDRCIGVTSGDGGGDCVCYNLRELRV